MNKLSLKSLTLLPKIAFLLCVLSPSFLTADETADVTVRAMPFSSSFTSGQRFELALVFTMTNGWHTYWQNPGEAGIPTTFDWTLPLGFSIQSMQEPVPLRHVEDGITTFIHEKEAIYLFQIQTPLEIPDSLYFEVNIDWLECKSICRAGSAELSFTLPKSEKDLPPVATKQLQKRAKHQYPLPSQQFQGKISRHGDQVIVNINTFKQKGSRITDVDFFPSDEMVYDISHKPELKSWFGTQKIRIPLLPDIEQAPTALNGILRITEGSGETLSISNILIRETIK